MAIYLIRHAHAGNRADWRDDDWQRPLSDHGRVEAEGIVHLLADRALGEIWSSSASRCTETAEPLAAARGLSVRTARELEEGADVDQTVAFLRARASADAALVSHGDVIPKVLRRLTSLGMRASGPGDCAKGSVWILETDGDQVVAATYHPPVGTAP